MELMFFISMKEAFSLFVQLLYISKSGIIVRKEESCCSLKLIENRANLDPKTFYHANLFIRTIIRRGLSYSLHIWGSRVTRRVLDTPTVRF